MKREFSVRLVGIYILKNICFKAKIFYMQRKSFICKETGISSAAGWYLYPRQVGPAAEAAALGRAESLLL